MRPKRNTKTITIRLPEQEFKIIESYGLKNKSEVIRRLIQNKPIEHIKTA
jgi:Arc/MetJ-type ribon-helix-helix transcriptional regulator